MQKITDFVMSPTLITKEQWDAITLWALAHGYSDLPEGKNAGKQPVGNITWFDALKFCNAAVFRKPTSTPIGTPPPAPARC